MRFYSVLIMSFDVGLGCGAVQRRACDHRTWPTSSSLDAKVKAGNPLPALLVSLQTVVQGGLLGDLAAVDEADLVDGGKVHRALRVLGKVVQNIHP